MSQYASTADLQAFGLPVAALQGIDAGKQNEFLIKASATIDSYLRGRYRLPVTGFLPDGALILVNSFPAELADACVAIAAYRLLVFRGFNPDEHDANFKSRHDFYLGGPGMKGWLDKLSAGAVSINSALDATPTTYEGAAVVAHASRRGWDDDSANAQYGELESDFWRRCC